MELTNFFAFFSCALSLLMLATAWMCDFDVQASQERQGYDRSTLFFLVFFWVCMMFLTSFLCLELDAMGSRSVQVGDALLGGLPQQAT